jgi:hypothetical protein
MLFRKIRLHDGARRHTECLEVASKTHDALRARIRAAGISRVSREAKVSRSVVSAFVNQGTVPHGSTIAKLEAALARLPA